MSALGALQRMSKLEFIEKLNRDGEKRTPCIVTNMFEGSILARCDSPASLREVSGETKVRLNRNYMNTNIESITGFLSGRKPEFKTEHRDASIAEYLDEALDGSQKDWMISEIPVPQRLLQGVSLDDLKVSRLDPGYDSADTLSSSDARCLMFLASAGNASDLHTDWDGRDVILYQCFGRKRVILFPPDAAEYLQPVSIFSTLRLNGMSAKDRAALLRYAGGVEDVIEGGEAVYMPAFFWHHLEYIDLAMSVNFRIGGIKDERASFLLKKIHRDMYLQNILAAFYDSEKAEYCSRAYDRVRTVYDRPYRSARDKYRAVRSELISLYKELIVTDERQFPMTWIDANTFLDGVLCMSYMSDIKTTSHLPTWLAKKREILRVALRWLGYRIAARA